MTIDKIYDELIEAYSPKNLNRITGHLISLYQNRNFDKIRKIANKVSDYVPVNNEKDSRCFSSLIMLYHPDKGQSALEQIRQLYEQKNYDNLHGFTHIFLLTDIDSVQINSTSQDIDYHPQYFWDSDQKYGFRFTDGYGQNLDEEHTIMDDDEKSFFNLIKIREYGRTDIELPTYHLEDFEEFEMEGSGMESLDGVGYCIHVKILDLANNSLSDISDLYLLKNIEELYLANNQIGYIDALDNLSNLKILDLSANLVDDISPLFELEHLEYVNLIDNPVPGDQIINLEKRCVLVITNKESFKEHRPAF